MKKADLISDLSGIQGGLDILAPDDESALLGTLKTTTERVRTTIDTLSKDLQSLAEKLPADQAKLFKQAALACSQIVSDSDWKKAEDLVLLMRAALGGVREQMKKLE